ncbi:MAG: MqnA/MqnD/SBP family protein [Sulfuricurvum sp.]|nr:MqnA/MqnD/SBP family protein [Sulfuricurvum sp.]
MIFGKIDFLNLLPFHVFMKRYAKTLKVHQSLNYHKGVPSTLNRSFAARRIDAAFISSIAARNCHHFNVGIVAKRSVLSVLSLPSKIHKDDTQSATSNLLAQILDIDGEVLIGDKALRYYYGGGECIDLSQAWYNKTHLPFVFALLCTHHHQHELKRLSHAFICKPIKIPHYILKDNAHKSNLTPAQIRHYLHHITYRIGEKERRGFKRFMKEAKEKRLVPPLGTIRYTSV